MEIVRGRRMEIICISLGGSIISTEEGINIDFVKKFSRILKNNIKRYKFIIVVGGGYANRLYINSTRSIINNNALLDEVGIAFTRINALMMKDLFKDFRTYPNVVTDLEELKAAINENEIVLMGGLIQGITTDASTVLACEVTGCKKLVNVSSVGYIYDKNPSEKGAKRLDRLNYQQLLELAFKYDSREAKAPFVFDLVGCKLARRSRIEIRFVSNDMEEIEKAIQGRPYKGSIVK
ncbi:MAG: UMP kinase [Candidatus Micrarchaeota archaeon]|nr:UMP kinase [Candidatus Micrarchaeota archaeon]